jgi:formylmethanofuran dehydrogenase subunit E
MDQANLPEDLKHALDFHGHLCPGLMIGWRAARAAAEALDLQASQDEELVAVVENDSCSVDAFQALLSTTFGKGNLKWLDHGKQVFTVIDRNKDRAVRVSFIGDGKKRQKPDGSMDREAFMAELLNAPQEELFEVREVTPQPPREAQIETSLKCERCGEPTQKSKMIEVAGQLLCRPCAEEVSR